MGSVPWWGGGGGSGHMGPLESIPWHPQPTLGSISPCTALMGTGDHSALIPTKRREKPQSRSPDY